MGDKPWWIKTSTGKFSVKSAWEILRRRDEDSEFYNKIWVTGLPFKISFFGWRVWSKRVLVAAVLATWNTNISPFCSCCVTPTSESLEHLFLKGEIATTVWKYFSNAAGILGPWIQLKQSMKKWWEAQGNSRQKLIFKATYSFVVSMEEEERNTSWWSLFC